MRSLERRFCDIANKNPFWSSYLCFAEAIRNQKFSKRIIALYFNKLVEKEDYDKSEKKEVVEHLFSLTQKDKNGAEDGMFWG